MLPEFKNASKDKEDVLKVGPDNVLGERNAERNNPADQKSIGDNKHLLLNIA